ncbi:MAG: hypothetical protein ABFD21_07570, partial [Anaerolineaceae bacterium]
LFCWVSPPCFGTRLIQLAILSASEDVGQVERQVVGQVERQRNPTERGRRLVGAAAQPDKLWPAGL